MQVKFNDNIIGLEIRGYEKHRIDDDDSWANVTWSLDSEFVQYKSSAYDLESIEVEQLRDMFKKFIDGQMQDMEVFVPIEPAFKIRFYPKGDEYSIWYDSTTSKKIIVNPNVELLVFYVGRDSCISESSFSYMLTKEEIEKFYNYLVDITK